MLWSQYHERCPEQRIRPCGVDRNLLVPSLYRKVHLRTVRFSNPVRLHLLDLLRPVQLIQVIKQPLRIRCNLQHPLTEVLLRDLGAAAFAFAIHDLFIGKTGLAGRTPVNREFLLIGKPFLEHLHENPLGPLIEFRVSGIHLPVPVIQSRNLINLLLDILHILSRGNRRMHAHLDGIVLSRKSECIPAHRVDDIVSLLQLIPAPYIRNHISSPMPHMKPVPGRVREHIQTIVFLTFFPILTDLDVDRVLLPVLTPFLLNCLMVVRYLRHDILSSPSIK